MEWSGNTRYAARFYQTRSSPPGLPHRSSIMPEQRGTTGGRAATALTLHTITC